MKGIKGRERVVTIRFRTTDEVYNKFKWSCHSLDDTMGNVLHELIESYGEGADEVEK